MGDPIFTGFDGVKFEFQGQKNKFYNLISAPEHLVRFRLCHLFNTRRCCVCIWRRCACLKLL